MTLSVRFVDQAFCEDTSIIDTQHFVVILGDLNKTQPVKQEKACLLTLC